MGWVPVASAWAFWTAGVSQMNTPSLGTANDKTLVVQVVKQVKHRGSQVSAAHAP